MGHHRDQPGNRLRAGTWADLTTQAMRDTGLDELTITRVLVRLAELAPHADEPGGRKRA